jgi:hypothetical protein
VELAAHDAVFGAIHPCAVFAHAADARHIGPAGRRSLFGGRRELRRFHGIGENNP